MTSPIGVTPVYPGATGGAPTSYVCTYDPAGPFSSLAADLLTAAEGEEVLHRTFVTNNAASNPTSGQMRFTFFTARKSEAITKIRVYSGGTAAAATPTLARVGIYSVDSAGAGTLVASNANDTSLFAATSTAYTITLSATFNKIAGQRYAWAPLVVSGTTMPTFPGVSIATSLEASGRAPVMAGALSSQADLPLSFTAVSLTQSGHRIYAVLVP